MWEGVGLALTMSLCNLMSSRDLTVEGGWSLNSLVATLEDLLQESNLFLDIGEVIEIESWVMLSKLTVYVWWEVGWGGGGMKVSIYPLST